MGYGDKKVVIDVTEREVGVLEYAGPDGLQQTYYSGRQMWLDLQDLQVWKYLRESEPAGSSRLVLQVRGQACLEDYDLSIIGEPTNKSGRVRVTFEASEVNADSKEAENVLGGSLIKPMGASQLGFSRADWEVGSSDEWWLACSVTEATLHALSEAVTTGALQGVNLGLRLKDIYTLDHPMAPRSPRTHLFLRPSRSDNTIEWPECATGYIVSLVMSLSRVDMRRTEVKDDDYAEGCGEVREVPQDPVAVAVGALTASVAALRQTIAWVGGIATVCLVILALK